ncbi:helix-turn-helix domain-containing protein [Hyphomicrobium sp.]|uniref:helix-turn-helix domain-containing protein n=1 Tax=Hyphomicrobium sp. TaxID=82 RepID=UPI002E2EF95D|nr:helix-turn-helix domain-containing protein [Hyphomicrobium sp.]HEX2840064.1 helix-turn-helix domain-containing protein [Hyphomicrobium sp.]
MQPSELKLLDSIDQARVALTPLRRSILDLLKKPNSAGQLARELSLPRQKIGYHLKCLQKAGLIREAGEKQKRGFKEKLYLVSAPSFVVDPHILGGSERTSIEKQDRYASAHLIDAAANLVREVSRMKAAAADQGTRLLTFAIETDVAFARPKDMELFVAELAETLHAMVLKYRPSRGGRKYRVLIGGRPTVSKSENDNVN